MADKIALITPTTRSHRTAEETLALGYLGSVLRSAEYEVSIVDGWLERLNPEEIISRLSVGKPPIIIGMSCYRSNLDQAAEILKSVRHKFGNIPAICGGYGPTFHSEDFLRRDFDVAVIGEAEHIIIPLTQALLKRANLSLIPGIVFMADGKKNRIPPSEPTADLNQIIFPQRDTINYALGQHDFVHLCTSRGCEAHCSFCSIFSFSIGGSKNLLWRHRSIGNIVDEIEKLYDSYGVRHFKFVDDSFIEPPRNESWAAEFNAELKKRRLSIKFRTQVRTDRLTSELVSILKDAGWFSTSIGVENASSTALKRMRKSASQIDNIRALEMLEENEIYIQMGMILFDPDTTMDELQENLLFLRKYTWPVNKGVFTEMYAAVGTQFTNKLKRRNLISRVNSQNLEYIIKDLQARRTHNMLRMWHRSHSTTYDWVIDSLTAPKILPPEGYGRVHLLFGELRSLDVQFFNEVLSYVSGSSDKNDDIKLVSEKIIATRGDYLSVEREIGRLYDQYGLKYDAVPNPFLSLSEETTVRQSEGEVR